MKIVAISDTHNRHGRLVIPECDLLIHAGDFTGQGMQSEVKAFAQWLDTLPAKDIIIVPGNHEEVFERCYPQSKKWITDECPGAIVLVDETVVIDGVKIHGSPVTPWFMDWAWNRARDWKEAQFRNVGLIQPHWDAIPEGTNILITHGPPYEILDELAYVDGTPKGQFIGCQQLLKRVKEVKPDLHIFGHIHTHGGREKHEDGTSFYNVAVCDEMYVPINPIRVIEYNEGE